MLRPNGRMAYLTIVVTPGLSKTDHRNAVRLGPRAVDSSAPEATLMKRAGFRDVEVTDVTHDYLEVARAWQTQFFRHGEELKQILGEQEWEERQSDRQGMIRGIEEGLLQRLLVTGRSAS